MKSSEPRSVRLVESVIINPEVHHLAFEVLAEGQFDFVPGQHLCLSKTINGTRCERHYSIASAPGGANGFEVCAKVVPLVDSFGRFLAAMKPGEDLTCQGPFGAFRLKEPVRDSVFVAAGTGLAPLRSMLRYLIAGEEDRSRGAELTMIFGMRRPDWRYYLDEFAAFAKRRPNFRFWPTVSRPADGWAGRTGYAQEQLAEALAGRSSGVDVYLCGHSAMVEDVRLSLEQAGFDTDSVVYEEYG